MKTLAEDHLRVMDRLIDRVHALHSAPQVVGRLLQLTRDPNFDLGEVVECLESEPTLAARVLRIVNSSFFGQRTKISGVRQAVTLLGQRTLRTVALTFSLVDSFTRGAGGRIYNAYWGRALTMASVASRISMGRREIDQDNAYSAGLLADLGILVFAQFENERYTALSENVAHGPELLEAERSEFGFTHPDLVARLLTRWEFPLPLVLAVQHHHELRDEAPRIEVAVHVGDLMADALYSPQSPHLERARSLLEERFEMDVDGFVELALACKKDIAYWCDVFKIRLPETIDVDGLEQQVRGQFSEESLRDDSDSYHAVVEDQRL